MSKENLEKNYMKLYLINEKNKTKILNKNEYDEIDFNNSKHKRRQQYLNKTYTKNGTSLNKMLNILIEIKDRDLQNYFNKLYFELNILAEENGDLAKS